MVQMRVALFESLGLFFLFSFLSPLRRLSALSLGFALCCCDAFRLENSGKLCFGSEIQGMRWQMANVQSHFCAHRAA